MKIDDAAILAALFRAATHQKPVTWRTLSATQLEREAILCSLARLAGEGLIETFLEVTASSAREDGGSLARLTLSGFALAVALRAARSPSTRLVARTAA